MSAPSSRTAAANPVEHRATWLTVVSALILAAACVGLAVVLDNRLPALVLATAAFAIGAPLIAALTRKTVDHRVEAENAYELAQWEAARARHDEVLREYSSWELDPEHLLATPGLWDYSRPEIQAFFDTMTRAHQLQTASFSEAGAEEYVEVVDKLKRTWHGATRYAHSVGNRYLDEDSRSRAETALKLWRHSRAASSREERSTYTQRALNDVNELVRRRIIPGTVRGVRELEAEARGAIER